MKLTRRNIDAIKPPESGYVLVRDSELPNYGIRVTAGGARSFFVQGRIGGRDRRITVGRYGVLTPEQARKEAIKLLGCVAAGGDPLADRSRRRLEAITLGDAFDAYLESRHDFKPTTVADMRRAMADLGWQGKNITGITPDMVERRHAELGKRSQARANLTMRYLRAVLNFAAEKYTDSTGSAVLQSNPVRRLSKVRAWYRVERRRTVLKEHELRPWMRAVLGLENADIRDYFFLLLLTGLRRQEAFDLLWRDVDLKARTLTIPDPKNRQPHTLPLSDYLLGMLQRRSTSAVGDYVFQSERGRLQNLRYALAAIEKECGIAVTPHDLRRTFATTADRLDVPGYAVKALLNHATGADVTAGYVVTDTERLRRPMQRITDFFLSAGGIRAGAEIHEIAGRV